MRKEVKLYDVICGGCGLTVRIESTGDASVSGSAGLPPGWSAHHRERMSMPSFGMPLHRAIGPPEELPPGHEGSIGVVWQELCAACTAAFSVNATDDKETT